MRFITIVAENCTPMKKTLKMHSMNIGSGIVTTNRGCMGIAPMFKYAGVKSLMQPFCSLPMTCISTRAIGWLDVMSYKSYYNDVMRKINQKNLIKRFLYRKYDFICNELNNL